MKHNVTSNGKKSIGGKSGATKKNENTEQTKDTQEKLTNTIFVAFPWLVLAYLL